MKNDQIADFWGLREVLKKFKFKIESKAHYLLEQDGKFQLFLVNLLTEKTMKLIKE